jgi:hypothetical protein
VFKITLKYKILIKTCIFNSQFINKVKYKGIKQELMKSRLIIQVYNDDSKHVILTQLLII